MTLLACRLQRAVDYTPWDRLHERARGDAGWSPMKHVQAPVASVVDTLLDPALCAALLVMRP